MISLRGTELEKDEREWLESPLLGGVILFARNFVSVEQLQKLTAEIHGVRSPSLLVAVDQEGGRVQRFGDPFSDLPPMRTLGHLHDRDGLAARRAARAFGWIMAAELLSVGVDLSFAPVVDLDLGLAEVIGDRALHSKGAVVARLAAEYVTGAREAGMAATAKHFPTHAGVRADSHLEPAVDKRDYDELDDDLLPYRRLIAEGLHSIMVAHVAFTALDPRPASFSSWWIEKQLREVLEFSGAVISDDISMAGTYGYGDPADRVRASLEAGCDLVLLCNSPDDVPPVIEALDGYVDPAAELRLMRLRGQKRTDWETLRASPRWREAKAVIDELEAPPKLELEG